MTVYPEQHTTVKYVQCFKNTREASDWAEEKIAGLKSGHHWTLQIRSRIFAKFPPPHAEQAEYKIRAELEGTLPDEN